ncbi:Succinate dehydrogenase assembly factor 3 [Dirofilaria immitis]|nr:Protein ACN9-like protein, mitochondrial [Dirofilaria immitis]
MSGLKSTSLKVTKALVDTDRFPLILYKRILRLHYGLPKEMRMIGDCYIKDEFRRHKNVSAEQALVFLKEWKEYCTILSKQLSNRGIAKKILGVSLNSTLLDNLQDDQLWQLYNLKLEAEKRGSDNNNKSDC